MDIGPFSGNITDHIVEGLRSFRPTTRVRVCFHSAARAAPPGGAPNMGQWVSDEACAVPFTTFTFRTTVCECVGFGLWCLDLAVSSPCSRADASRGRLWDARWRRGSRRARRRLGYVPRVIVGTRGQVL